MDDGIIITPGLQVTLAPRASVRDDEIFVSRDDAPALIEKINALLLPKDGSSSGPEINPESPADSSDEEKAQDQAE